jgi:tRNA-specific 2-thiouridylase
VSVVSRQLAKSLFPIGELTKPQVREIAAEMELVTAEKKRFSRICFIEKFVCRNFLAAKLQPKDGLIVQIDKMTHLF